MTPSVSILLPVWNAEQTLEACLHSVQRQTLKEWECVVVDDGSNDGSVEVAQQIASSDRRIRVVETEHLGLVSTLNTGIDHCEAPLVARMDADDLMHRTRLEQQKSTLDAASDLCGVGSHVRLFPRRITNQIDERPLPGESTQVRKGRGGYESWLNSITSRDEVSREAYVECPIAHPTLMLRRDTLANYRYRDMGWPEDYDLVLRLLAQGQSLVVVPSRLLSWRDHDARLSRTSRAYSLEQFVACKAYHLCETLLRERTDYVLWGYGDTGRAMFKALAKHDRYPSHIVELHPRRIGNTIQGAKVIHPDALSSLERKPLIASVAGAGAREEIRQALGRLNYREGKDFVCAA